MKKTARNFLIVLPVFLGLLISGINYQAVAIEIGKESQKESQKDTNKDTLPSDIYTTSEDTDSEASQDTSVSQLTDVQPTDWAFQALQSLVERYGCIAGYPGGKYLGNRSITRYEFAAGLNSCLQQVTKLIASTTDNLASKQDTATVERLSTEFRTELAQLSGRVDKLDTRLGYLESHQFATTTKLSSIVETVLGGVLAGTNVVTKQNAARNFTFSDDVQLRLDTSFNGTDDLRLILAADNITSLGLAGGGKKNPNNNTLFATVDGKISDVAPPSFPNNQVNLSAARYRFLAGKDTSIDVFALTDGVLELGLSPVINPYFEGASVNGISRYSRRNMVFDYGDSGSGAAVIHKFDKDHFELGLEYTAVNPNNPAPGNGLINGRYTALGQLVYLGNQKNFRVGFTYANVFSPSGGTGIGTGQSFGPSIGSNLANSSVPNTATLANLYGLEAFYKISPRLAVNGWVGYAAQRYLGTGDGDVFDWATGISFPDLFRKGSLGGLFVGMEPKLISVSKNVDFGTGLGPGAIDKNTSLHIEGFYQFQLNEYIGITPGIIWVTKPNFDSSNPDSVVVWLRTTFKF